MMVNTDNLVSITEANQNFSKVARMVDKNGSVVILKNNVPKYLIVEFNQAEAVQTAPDEDPRDSSQRTEKPMRNWQNDDSNHSTNSSFA